MRIGDREARVHYVLDQAEIPTFQQLQRYDADGSGAIDTAARGAPGPAQSLLGEISSGLELTAERAARCRSARPRTRSSAFRRARAGSSLTRVEVVVRGHAARPARGTWS